MAQSGLCVQDGVIFTPEEVSKSREQSAAQASLGLNIDQEERPTKLGVEKIKIFNLIMGTGLAMFISTFRGDFRSSKN